jgi:hypothetical protein
MVGLLTGNSSYECAFLYSLNVMGYGNNSVLLTKGEDLLRQITLVNKI